MLTRRRLLQSIPAIAMAPLASRVFAQAAAAIRVRGFNHVTLSVSDVKRSVDFYQGLFGMPIISRQGMTANLLIGAGPQFLASARRAQTRPPSTICLGVEDFNVDRITAILVRRGLTRTGVAGNAGGGGLGDGPMKMRVRVRGPETGGAGEGTPELLSDPGLGVAAAVRIPATAAEAERLGAAVRAAGTISEEGLPRFSSWAPHRLGSDGARANAFYQDLSVSGSGVSGTDGARPGVGGVQFLMFAGAGRGRVNAPGSAPSGSINHLCMNMDGFNPDSVIKALESYGIKPRGSAQGPAGPLVHYISMRMENRGGAKEGTPELYFTDPDGLLIQLQDTKYCGGAGVLGDVCQG
jgi:catechol 2,3-dioxygenase-like lactoylglutathione lyase family enzyme